MNTLLDGLRYFVAAALLFSAAQRPSLAGSATWATNPASGDWNTATNWMPQTVPNSTTDVATFGRSSLTNLSIADTTINLDRLIFNSGAPLYTLTSNIAGFFLNGAGIVNNSGSVQSFAFPEDGNFGGGIFFFNSSTAGMMTSISSVGGNFAFFNTSSAGSATFDIADGVLQADMNFNDNSTAGEATINASAGSVIEFLDSSTGGSATLNLSTGAFVLFEGSNNAEHMVGNCIGGDEVFNSEIEFEGFSSAGEGTFTTIGGSTSGEQGGFILFDNRATADNATLVINGGMGAGLSGTYLVFIDLTNAAGANITANGGVEGSAGGLISFEDQSKGGTCQITLSGNAELDISAHGNPGLTIGSLSGAGSVLLGTNTLTIGSTNQSTTFTGVVQGSGGVTKSGTGTLTLSGANLYTGTTTVSAGTLVVSNKKGSGTGTGAVAVSGGTLGGKGIIAGAVTVNPASFLAPATGTKTQATLTLQSPLTFNSSATYTYTFKAKGNKAKTDKVIANGVTINSGASFNLSGTAQGTLTQGLTLTVISNTSAAPISGAFGNLLDGAILTVGSNHLQASYSGGDGNDLTLTVVP